MIKGSTIIKKNVNTSSNVVPPQQATSISPEIDTVASPSGNRYYILISKIFYTVFENMLISQNIKYNRTSLTEQTA